MDPVINMTIAKVNAKAIGTTDQQFEIRVWANSPQFGRMCAQRYTIWDNGESQRIVEDTFIPSGSDTPRETSRFPTIRDAVLEELISAGHWAKIRQGAVTAPVETRTGYRGIYTYVTGETIPMVSGPITYIGE